MREGVQNPSLSRYLARLKLRSLDKNLATDVKLNLCEVKKILTNIESSLQG